MKFTKSEQNLCKSAMILLCIPLIAMIIHSFEPEHIQEPVTMILSESDNNRALTPREKLFIENFIIEALRQAHSVDDLDEAITEMAVLMKSIDDPCTTDEECGR